MDGIMLLNQYPAERYNVLCPVTAIQANSSLQKIVVSQVSLDTRQNQGNNGPSADIYWERSCNKFAITKVGGMKLAAAANISIVSSQSCRTEVCQRCIEMASESGKARTCGDCPHVHDVAYTVTIRVPEPSGGNRLMAATKEIDCTVEAMSMKDGMNGQQYQRFLKHRQANAESKAFMRALRAALGLQGGYTLEELKKPFIIARAIPNLDAPEIKEAVASSLLANMGLLYELPAYQNQRQALPAGQTPPPQAQPIVEEIPAYPDEAPPEMEPNFPYQGDGYGPTDYGQPPEYNYPPQDQNGAQGRTQGAGEYICSYCHRPLTASKGKNGKEWTPAAIAGYSNKQFGQVLCPDCQKRMRGGR